MNKSFLQRVPDNLLAQVEAWALSHGGVTRTVAINLLIIQGLESDEREILRAKVEELQREVIKLNSIHMPLIKALQRAAEGYKMEEQKEYDQCNSDIGYVECDQCIGIPEDKRLFCPAFKKERRAVL